MIDEAISKYPHIVEWMKQGVEDKVTKQQSMERLLLLTKSGG